MLRKEKSLLHFLIHSLAGGLFAFVLIFQQYWSLSCSRRKETIFLLEKIKVDDGIFSGLNVKRRFSDYRFWNEAVNFVLRVSFTVGLFSYQGLYLASHQMTPPFLVETESLLLLMTFEWLLHREAVLNLKLWAGLNQPVERELLTFALVIHRTAFIASSKNHLIYS